MPQLCTAHSCLMNRQPRGPARDKLPTELSTGLSTVISTALSTGTHAHWDPFDSHQQLSARSVPGPYSPTTNDALTPGLEIRLFGVDTHIVYR